MLTFIHNPRTWETRVEDGEFKANMDYIAKPCLNNSNKQTNKKTVNPSPAWSTERVLSQDYTGKPFQKTKKRKERK